jgi:hypothetical protein
MASQIDINLSTEVLQRWQTAKNLFHHSVDSIANSAQQLSQSLKQIANTTSDQARDIVKTTLEQTGQTAIAASVNDWLTEHPAIFRLLHVLSWSVNHPIISLVILLLTLAVISSMIKGIMSLISQVSWSILQIPLKLMWSVIQFSFVSLTKLSSLPLKSVSEAKTPPFIPSNSQTVYQDKQQRLAEISRRLELIQQEQQQLLQEAANLMATDSIDLKIEV